jgi:hypothetical protein
MEKCQVISDFVEAEIPVDVQQAVMPVENQVLFRNFLTSCYHQLHGVVEMRLAQWNLVGVDVRFLKSCKKELSWSSIVAVWSQYHDWNLKPL